MAKRVVLFIHGMSGTGELWTGYRRVVEARGYETRAPSLRHHCPGPPDPALGTVSLLDYVADLAADIQTLEALPVIVGHSMGGLLAQLLAARGLAHAAVLLTPAAPRGYVMLRPSVFLSLSSYLMRRTPWRTPFRARYAEMAYGMFNRVAVDARRAAYAGLVHESGRAIAEIGFWWLDRLQASRVDPDSVRCPLLVCACRHDRVTPASLVRRIAQRYAHAEFVEFPDNAHWIFAEPHAERIASIVADWIDATEAHTQAAACGTGSARVTT